MYCKVCGEKCPEGAEFCTKCGQKLNETNETVYQTPVVEEVEEKKGGKGLGIASLIMGICSIICCFGNGPFAILGLIFGIISNKKNKNGKATAGIVLSAITIALIVIAVIACIAIYLISGVSALALIGAESSAVSPGYYY